MDFLQFYNDQSGQQCEFLDVGYTLLCMESWTTDSRKTGGVLEGIRGYKISLSAIQISICQKQPNFKIPYFRPSKCRLSSVPPEADAPLLPPAATAFIIHF